MRNNQAWYRRSPTFLLLLLGVMTSVAAQTPPTMAIVTGLSHSQMSARIENRLQLAYQQLGYRMTLQRLPSGRSLLMSNAGEFDGELFRISDIAPQYPNLRQVPTPLEHIQLFAFVRKDASKSYMRWQDNRQLRVAYVRGFKLAEHYRSQGRFRGQPMVVTTVDQAVNLLLQGKIDVLLEDIASLQSSTFELASTGQLQQLPEVLASRELYHYVHKKHQHLLVPLAKLLADTAQ